MDDQGPIPGDLGLTLLQLPLARAEGRLLSALGAAQRPVPHVTHWTGCHPQGPGSDVLSACLVAGMLWLSSWHRWATHSPSLTHVFEGRAASARCRGLTAFPRRCLRAHPHPHGSQRSHHRRDKHSPSATRSAQGAPSPVSTPPPQLPKRSRLWPGHPASRQTAADAATAALLAWVKGNGAEMGPGSPAPPAQGTSPSPRGVRAAVPRLSRRIPPCIPLLPAGATLPPLPPAPAEGAAEPAHRPAPESKVPRP